MDRHRETNENAGTDRYGEMNENARTDRRGETNKNAGTDRRREMNENAGTDGRGEMNENELTEACDDEYGGKTVTYLVGDGEAGRHLRDILRGPMGVSYSAMKSAKWNGRLYVNGEGAHTNRILQAGDLIRINWEADKPVYTLKPYDYPISVAYEDEDLLIVDKPAGLASQSSRNHPDDSLENALYARAGCPANFIYRPVNRLDKGTGGLMAVARNPYSQHLLQKQLHTDSFLRRYLAMTDGCPPAEEGTIRLPIGKEKGATIRRTVMPEGKPSVTRYRVLKTDQHRSLLLLQLETGRTHQIRVHLSALGCPVRGDFLYGKEDPAFPGCLALHSAVLRLVHPVKEEPLCLISLPSWAGDIEDSVLLMDFD